MNNIKRPTTLEEIRMALGKSKRTVEVSAKKGGWEYTEENGSGKNKKRLYALKNLPKDIQQAIFSHRFNLGVNHGQHQTSGESSPASTASNSRGNEPGADQRNHGSGNEINDVPGQIHDGSGNKTGIKTATMGASKAGRLGKNTGSATLLCPGTAGGGRTEAVPATQGAGANETDQTPATDPKKRVLAADRKGATGSDLAHASGGGLSSTDESRIDDRQRLKDGSRQVILQFVESYPGSVEAACEYLTHGYAAGSLAPDLAYAIQHCNDKLNANRIGKVSASTVGKWRQLKNKTGHCLPSKTRIKIDWQSVWWFHLFLSCYRKPQKPKLTEAHAEFKKNWLEQSLSLDEFPSYHTVNRLLSTVPPIIRETGRCTGSEMAALKSFVRRDWSGSSNEVWVGDGHTFKAKVRHPETGRAFAPEVTVIIDAASRFIVGWAFSLSENQIAVSEALGQAMLKHGKPLIYYSDNGSGQTAKTIDCPAGGMLARLGVRHQTGIPGNPQGRGLIEGLWDITAIAVAKTFPTFQGTGMDDGALRKVTAAINSAKRKGEVPTFVPSWQAFMAACEERFDTYNNEHKHSSLGGKPPAEVYFANFDESWSCPLTEDETLNLYRPFVERMPRRGEVTWINNIYFNQKLVELPEKTKVRVAYDMHHADHVWISDLQGRFICVAVWDGNKVDGFQKSFVEKLKDQRIDGIEKLALEKAEAARAERYGIIDGEVLERIPAIPQEVIEPLVRVQPIPREADEPLKSPVIEGGFNRQEPEEKTMTRQETTEMIQKLLEAKNKGG